MVLRGILNRTKARQISKLLQIDSEGKRMIPVEVYRYRGGSSKPYTETFDVDTKDTPMVLDVLLKIKNTMDPTLTIRRSWREGICGSCSMNIAGTNTLACLCTLEEAITPDGKIRVYPLPHMTPIKDLVPDMNRFYEHHASVEPWLHLTPEQEKSKTYKAKQIELNLMVCMNVFCVLVVRLLVQVIGGMEMIIIWDLLFFFKLSVGFLIQEMLQCIIGCNN